MTNSIWNELGFGKEQIGKRNAEILYPEIFEASVSDLLLTLKVFIIFTEFNMVNSTFLFSLSVCKVFLLAILTS